MNFRTVCGQTSILNLVAGVREHLAAKGYKETLYVFKKFGTILHGTQITVTPQ